MSASMQQLGLFDLETMEAEGHLMQVFAERSRSAREDLVGVGQSALPDPAAQVETTIADIVSRANLLDPSALVVEAGLKIRPDTVRRWVREFALGVDGDTAAQRFCNHILTGIASNRPEVGDRRAEQVLQWVPLFMLTLDERKPWQGREKQ